VTAKVVAEGFDFSHWHTDLLMVFEVDFLPETIYAVEQENLFSLLLTPKMGFLWSSLLLRLRTYEVEAHWICP
jgi:hypothetical protein